MTREEAIERIAELSGIAPRYWDIMGRCVETSFETKVAILSGLGLAVESEALARESLDAFERKRGALLPATLAVPCHERVDVRLQAPAADVATWRLRLEAGEIREGRAALHFNEGAATLSLPALPAGYHHLHVATGERTAEATLIAAPARCYEPSALRDESRLWGASAQVYALRSERNLGIGDYTDVADAAQGCGALGASFLGLSPVHALFHADRTRVSPYSPSSRLFLETLFIDPTTVEGFVESGAASLMAEAQAQGVLEALRSAPFVDHAGVWRLKRQLLDLLWEHHRHGAGEADFAAFRRAGGRSLQAHGAFEALSEHFLAEGRQWAGEWPAAFRDPGSSEVRRFEHEHADAVAFHVWLQWQADRQLARAAERARLSGMGVGLYRDLAVGASADGSEIWADGRDFAQSLSIGAPPDPFGPDGQNWGLPPFNPLALEETGLAAFRALVSANMRHAGAIRIDHAFQLQRLFLIPSGLTALEGAYLAYPFDALLAALRLESHRSRCLVIAEDLGTAPHGFSDAVMHSGVLSYRVLLFERHGDGSFKRPESYPRQSLASFTTHDLPTFRGWCRGLDIDLRQTLGLFDHARAENERTERSADVSRFMDALAAENLLPPGERPSEPTFEATMRFLARSASVLVGLQLEDAAGELNQTNLPGPDQGHPNWKRRHQTDIETLTAPGGDLAKIAAALAEEGRGLKPNAGMLSGPPPRATYRLQFHSAFTFDDAVRIVPYLAALGISHVYASPIQTARPHSTHGYDIVDHATINPELGGEDGFFRLTDALRDNGLGLVLDVVPNHMGVGGADNAWWLSVLEWGELSSFGNAFDIDWERLGANHKLIVPFLSGGYGDVLEKGDLNLTFDAAEGSFSVWHFEHRFPLCPLSYPVILDRALAALPDGNDQGAADLIAISERLRTMNDEAAPDHRRGFPDESAALKSRLAETVAASGAVRQAIERAVVLVNGTPGIPESFGTLHRILETQSYRLAYWRVAASDINYRRFFDINALAGLRVEDPVVFERSHAMIFRLVREGRIQGLRIDHVDGLADPESYVRALQSAVGPGFYILVEKILEPGEELRPWPIAGTTGYEVLNQLDGIFVDSSSADRLESLYRAATAFEGRYGVLLREAKAEVLESSFASELEGAVSDLKRLADSDRRTRDYTVYAIHRALVEIVARLPVYRTYLGESEPGPEDRALIESTIEAAKRSSMLPDRTVHDFAAAIILGDAMPEGAARLDSDLVRRFRRRFQQLTGPVMAKSLEDTLFYRYVRMLSLNEVGGDPNRFGVSLDEFHRANVARARLWPHSLIATATHDTKRGEDARARLSVLSEIPQIWGEALDAWAAASVPHLTLIAGEKAPDANDRYLILQSILGAWPIELLDDEENEPAVGDFRDRIESYALKAVREAKRYTSWVHANAPYEEAIAGFVRGILDPQSPFVREFRPLARRMAYAGMLTSLSRTVLKCTIPGVPDFYQGTEWWDLSLVDPDNRRPIDYEKRAEALLAPEPTQALMGTWPDGRLKQRLVAILLADRGAAPALYANGDYRPLKVTGPKAGHVIAFVRSSAAGRVAVIVPRVTGALLADGKLPFGTAWDGTGVSIPRGEWRDLFTGAKTSADGGVLPLDAIFARLPFCVLRADHDAAEATKP